MKREVFEERFRALYPDKNISFNSDKVQNVAYVEGFKFTNIIFEQEVEMFWPDGTSAGRAYAVERPGLLD